MYTTCTMACVNPGVNTMMYGDDHTLSLFHCVLKFYLFAKLIRQSLKKSPIIYCYRNWRAPAGALLLVYGYCAF